jgi:uncharacterized protein (TIGR02270 family)
MVIQDVVAQHAEEAAFLWTTRERAVGVPRYSLKSLAALDERVDAHLDGLRIAGDAGWALCRANLENAEASVVFPLAVLAFETGDRQRMLDALTAGCISAETRRGLVSALGWLDYQTVAPWVRRLLDAKAAAHRAIGVAACAVQRQDPGAALTSSIDDPDPILRSRALRAVGELKRRDLLNQVRHHLTDEDEQCRFWAAWTLTLYRDRAGLQSLAQWLGKGDRFGRLAILLSVRAMSLEDGRHWIRTMANDPGLRRCAVIGAGALGDPSSVPWLIGNMQSPELSRLAGEAFSMMTGVDLEAQDLDQDGPGPASGEAADEPSAVDAPDLDEDSHLTWPKHALVEQWWRIHRADFQDGMRYLAGQPLTTPAAREVLRAGNQRQRAAAAIELALREPDEILFEVRGRGTDQQRRLFAGDTRP